MVVLILVSGTYFSLVSAAFRLGWFSRYACIVSFFFPTRLFARAFGHVYVVHDVLLPSHVSLAPFHSCIFPCVGMPLCSA